MIGDKNLNRICEKGFDEVEKHVNSLVWHPEYSHMVYYDKWYLIKL